MTDFKTAYDNAYAAARVRPAFSNGTEGDVWMEQWCSNCEHDAAHRKGTDDVGCPLIIVALQARTPAEWEDGPRDEHGRYSMANQYHCTRFEQEATP